MIYGLYHNKEELKLEIKPFDKTKSLDSDEVVYWNNRYYLCSEVKPLREMAKVLRSTWTAEFERNIDKLNNEKLKVRYK